jgi:UDP-N-acetylglucosamine--N-acetylmuramyl-(pentapeptide) pyrophosphoryl-undecaprenol N-acetylglucosamine transferase
MASRMKIPTLIHEQNAYPGVTNKILSRFVDVVAVSFKESCSYFKASKKLVHTGNPIRLELLNSSKATSRKRLGISAEKQLVVVVGGSRGAKKINDAVADMLLKSYKPDDFDIIFATGEIDYERISGMLQGLALPSVKVVPYIFDAGDVYASADLVICRAGAITSSELTALGTPSVMIPSPNVTANHQEYNARALEKQGAAVVILDRDLNGSLLYQQIINLFKDKNKLGKMANSAKKIGITDAAEKIYSLMQELLHGE